MPSVTVVYLIFTVLQEANQQIVFMALDVGEEITELLVGIIYFI